MKKKASIQESNSSEEFIRLRGAAVHNLKGIDLDLPKNSFIVFSGVSGSGKSSLAFDTLYSEGQRRYVESLSSQMRRHLDSLRKPDIVSLDGLSPTIAIEQKTAGKNPRSTVGTMTEIYDHLRVLYARLATPFCPVSGKPLAPLSREELAWKIKKNYKLQAITLMAPVAEKKRAEFESERIAWLAAGYLRVFVDGELKSSDEPWNLDPEASHNISLVIDRLVCHESETGRLFESLFKALELTEGLVQVMTKEGKIELFSTHAYSEESGLSYRPLEPEDFSFNNEKGMCSKCQGLGWATEWDLKVAIDENKSLAQDCCKIASSYQTVRNFNIFNNLARIFGFSVHTPWNKLSQKAKDIILYGASEKWLRMEFVNPNNGYRWQDRISWTGILAECTTRYTSYKSERAKEAMRPYLKEGVCSGCLGDRINPYARHAKWAGLTLPSFCRLSISEALEFLKNKKLSEREDAIGRELIASITKRLQFLEGVGLGYMSLDRTAPTLSGGEAQRVRLSSQIGSGLVGVTYILDEPSIGLHASDNEKLVKTLRRLRDNGSNLIVVEHDEETILSADHIVDFGPGAGSEGGKILYNGPAETFLDCKESITAAYLSGRQTLSGRKARKESKRGPFIKIKKASHNNLKKIDVTFPLGRFVVVTGVSGSGKSSLVSETLYSALANHYHGAELKIGRHEGIEGLEHLDKIIAVDQSPIGRLPRSNPATYVKVFDDIRELFSLLPESRAAGYDAGRFSFNVKEGSCSHCQGLGVIRLDMDFLEDEYVICPKCEGEQFDASTLSITYKGHNIRSVLKMSVDEAAELFKDQPKIASKLSLLSRVGLGYLPLGQPSPYLSGGEAQRIKLARELIRPPSGRTLYILDEPTTGLHLHNIGQLLEVLQQLVDRGNSVIMIEHHLEVIRQADYLIEIGPCGGAKGGYLVASGSPGALAKIDCPTGKMLRKKLKIYTDSKKKEVSHPHISISRARQNNLKDVSVEIDRHKITTIVGPSGSGKSSLAMETLYASGQRKYVDCLSAYARQFVKPCKEPRVERVEGLSPCVCVETRANSGNARSTLGTLTEIYDYLRLLFTRVGVAYCPKSLERIESVDRHWIKQKISELKAGTKLQILAPFEERHSSSEMVKKLMRLGFSRIRLNGALYDVDESLESILKKVEGKRYKLEVVIDRIKAHETEVSRLDNSLALAEDLGKGQLAFHIFEEKGERDFWINMGFCVPSTGESYPSLTPQLFAFNTREGWCLTCHGIGEVENFKATENDNQKEVCPDCQGSRLNPLASHVRVAGKTMSELVHMPLTKLHSFIENLRESLSQHQENSSEAVLRDVAYQLFARIGFLLDVGLGYLQLGRSSTTLSGGEIQRTRLAAQLGSGLSGIAYILDEPSTGLHAQDTQNLLKALEKLKNLGNTLVIVDHQRDLILASDHIIEMGPGAGHEGGRVLNKLTSQELTYSNSPLVTDLLKPLEFKKKVREPTDFLEILGAKVFELKNIDVKIPLGVLAAVTGVSGSGKSTLVETVIANLSKMAPKGRNPARKAFKHKYAQIVGLDKFDTVDYIDSEPLGLTSRSDVGSYIELQPKIRELFAKIPEAKSLGLKPGAFSPNTKSGMCTACHGHGFKTVDLRFLPPVELPCTNCQGLRLNPLSLSVQYKGYNFGQLLKKSAKELLGIIGAQIPIARRLQALVDVGLGYLPIGFETAHLSIGESQRLKLATRLGKMRKKTLFLLDEPCKGLGPSDIAKVQMCLNRLVDAGHSVLVIEHQVNFIASCDFLIEMGPGSGANGGMIVASGKPRELAQKSLGATGHYLKRYLEKK